MKILIIDDDKRFQTTLVEEFNDHGYIAYGFNSYAEFCMGSDQQFTHAVIDLRLKNENGIDVISDLKLKNSTIKIIMLTGFGSIATAVTAVKAGADDYLSKPVDIDILINTLLGNKIVSSRDSDDRPMSLAKYEREYIELILNKCDGNISKAAKVLGLHRQSLQRMLKKYPSKN